MTTTIQVQESTAEILKQLRKSMNAASLDEVISKVIQKSFKVDHKLHGILGKKGMKWVMKDLRDKDDR